jgi:integrase
MSVFKLRRPKSQWKSPTEPAYYDTYYFKLHGEGGKQILRTTHATDKAAAEKVESAAKRKVKTSGWQALLDALEPGKARRTLATLGDIEAAYMDEAVQLVRNAHQARANVASLFRLVAYAMNLWTTAAAGQQGVKAGRKIHDIERIRKLSSGVLTGDLVRRYFAARQGGELDLSHRKAENISINSTLGAARQLFSRRSKSYKMRDLKLPDLKGFQEEPPLPKADSEAQPLTGDQWEMMVEAAKQLADRELALVNQLLRVTGMRTAEITAMHASWLVPEGTGWAIEIKDRSEKWDVAADGAGKGRLLVPEWSQKGVKNRKVPVPPDLVELLRSRPDYLIGPDLSTTARRQLVAKKHNFWLKGMIGGRGEKVQGNHRLRDTVCSALWSLYGPSAAQEAAGHVSPVTTSKHYAKHMSTVPAGMVEELAVWAPGNVVSLRGEG